MSATYAQGDQPVPGYRLVKFLGRGGFGEVWKANGPGGTEVALKILRLGGLEGRKEFRSLQLVKRIHHPNLVAINAFWLKAGDGSLLDETASAADGAPETEPESRDQTTLALPAVSSVQATELIIAMGLGEKNLSERLEECRREGHEGIPLAELLHYMETAAEAIDFLNSPRHKLGPAEPAAIQHCDIKPQNLIIVGGSAQVCDFGLARMLGAARTSTAAATVAYAPPECLERGDPSAATDQYSLAVSYYELRTGRLPFRAETLGAVMKAKRRGLDFSGVSAGEQTVLRKATARHPDARYASTSEMVRTLREAAAADRAPRLARRGPLVYVAAALTLAAALGLGIMLSLWLLGPVSGGPGNDSLPDDGRPPVEGHLARGTEHLRNGQFDQAVAELSAAARLDPRNAQVLSRLAVAHSRQGNWQQALETFTLAIELPGNDARDMDYYLRGLTHLQMGESAKAERDFDAAIAENPNHAPARYWRGISYFDKPDPTASDLEQARAHFSKVIELFPTIEKANFTLADVYQSRALCQLAAAEPGAAAADLTKAIELSEAMDPAIRPPLAEALRSLAESYAAAGDYAKAVTWVEKAVTWAPDAATAAEHEQYRQSLEQRLEDPP